MSSDAAPKLQMSYAEFIVFEEQSLMKHEWLDGVVYDREEVVPTNQALRRVVNDVLGHHACATYCRIVDVDWAIQALHRGLSLYPDVLIVYQAVATSGQNDATLNIQVIVEKSRSNKNLVSYQRIPSLAEYVRIWQKDSQKEKCIEVFRRISGSKGADEWDTESEKAFAGQTITLKSVECELSVDEVYEDPLAA